MKKKFLLFLLAISLIMCRNKYNNQSNQDDVFAQIKYIKSKYILHNTNNSSIEAFSNNKIYILEGKSILANILQNTIKKGNR